MTPELRRQRPVVGALIALFFALLPAIAQAQIFKLCGDVDNSKTVTVTDGVQVLRAAAGLSSDCTDEVCDADVNGEIGVTDGVIILRKAAGLTITEDCIPDEGHINNQVAQLIRETDPLVSAVLPTVLQHVNDTLDGNSFECLNGEDGTYDISFADGEQDTSFSSCLVGNALIDGDVENANGSPILSIELSHLTSDNTIDFDGTDGTALLAVKVEGGVKYSGRLDVSPSFGDDTSDFLLVVQNLQVGPTGFPVGGSLQFVLTADSNVVGVHEIQIFYDGSNLARVLVTFSDGSFKSYKFEQQFKNFI